MVYDVDLSQGFVGPLMAVILLSLDWGVPTIFPWNKSPKFKHTYCFWLPGHNSWGLQDLLKALTLKLRSATNSNVLPTKSHHENLKSVTHQFSSCEKYGVSHTPILYPEGFEQTNWKSSEHKTSKTWSKRSLPEIPERGWRDDKPKGLCGYLHPRLGAIPESSTAVLRSHLIAKTVNDKTKTT